MKPCIPIALLCAVALPAQMELRFTGNYDIRNFVQADPAVGAAAPDLVLRDLDGRPWSLHQQLGSFVVLVKGSFT